MRGSGIPIIGNRPIVILTFTAKWKNKILATLYAYTLLNVLLCLSAIMIILIKKNK
jgi:hypothetical protein